MDAPCKIQGSIHVFRLVNNMCPGKWVHITLIRASFFFVISTNDGVIYLVKICKYIFVPKYILFVPNMLI